MHMRAVLHSAVINVTMLPSAESLATSTCAARCNIVRWEEGGFGAKGGNGLGQRTGPLIGGLVCGGQFRNFPVRQRTRVPLS